MIEQIANWTIHIISTMGYAGIILTMAIESALIPLPSEIIMPFSGFLASTGRFNLFLVALAGAIGNVVGSFAAYQIGYYGHEKVVRRFIRKWGKWLLISEHELDLATKYLHKNKDIVVLTSRVIPGVRTVISLPCGIARLPLFRFLVLTFIGSFIWSFLLAYLGFILGQNWETLGPFFHKFDVVIILGIIIAVGFYIYKKVKNKF